MKNVIIETEKGDGGLTYRYTYGLHKENVVVYGIENGQGSLLEPQHYLTGDRNIVKLYCHHDHLGSTDYLTANKDNKLGEVVSYADYDDWGQFIGNSIVEMGIHKLDLVEEYTGYTYDRVLDLYCAKARLYDAADRRFVAVDWAGSNAAYPQTFNQYTYVIDNPLRYVDLLGLTPTKDSLVSGGTITVGSNIINNVYVDNGKVYVDFFEAAKAWGVSVPSFSGGSYQCILFSDTGVRANIQIFQEHREWQITSSIFDTNKSLTPGYKGIFSYSDVYRVDNRFLVDFEYFEKLMCEQLGYKRSIVVKLPYADLKASWEAKKVLIIIEAVNTVEHKNGKLVIDNGTLTGIRPRNVGDGSITTGIGDWLDKGDYDWYQKEYGLSRTDVGTKTMPIDRALAKMNHDINDSESRINNWCRNNDVQLKQNEFDACIIGNYQFYSLGQDILNLLKKGVSNVPRNEMSNAFLIRHGKQPQFIEGYRNRTNVEMRVMYNNKYTTLPEFTPIAVNIPGFGQILPE